MKITIGGDRLGSGKKMRTDLPNYGRSTHDLTEGYKTSAAPGVLYPFLKKVALNGDTFEINLDSQVITVPTKAPLFGSFKLQLDVFACPWRLYQGILHNNPIDIGLKMNKVFLPQMELPLGINTGFSEHMQVAPNALVKYMGISGGGIPITDTPRPPHPPVFPRIRKLQCIPELAYYDIFKNYYANKQEKNAYVITPLNPDEERSKMIHAVLDYGVYEDMQDNTSELDLTLETSSENDLIVILELGNNAENINNTEFIITSLSTGINFTFDTSELNRKGYFKQYNLTDLNRFYPEREAYWRFSGTLDFNKILNNYFNIEDPDVGDQFEIGLRYKTSSLREIQITPFELKNIDLMRESILKNSELGIPWTINENCDILPFSTLTGRADNDIETPYNAFNMNGLVLKTYQSDLFNNWLDTEWIDGENGIAELTAITAEQDPNTGEYKVKLDDINFSEKLYNVLNRIAISGGTYQDWQKAVYGQALNFIETPVWCGGMSSEIVFEQVISTAETTEQKLGGLAGKGKLLGKKGGSMTIKVNEPSYIIGIMSITPRIDQTQGNDWDRTEITTLDDLHKPELDGIGFQNLMCEQMAWWDAKIHQGSDESYAIRTAAGKVPAWINYMTSYDKAYGDFANINDKNYMVLARNYEIDQATGNIKDLTTYIDPSKFNYAFAVQELAAQNFWVQIVSHIKTRRKMSAKIIPNL